MPDQPRCEELEVSIGGVLAHGQALGFLLAENVLEIRNRASETSFQRRARRPGKQIVRSRDIWPTLPRIVLGTRAVHYTRAGASEFDHKRGKFSDRALGGIAEIQRPDD